MRLSPSKLLLLVAFPLFKASVVPHDIPIRQPTGLQTLDNDHVPQYHRIRGLSRNSLEGTFQTAHGILKNSRAPPIRPPSRGPSPGRGGKPQNEPSVQHPPEPKAPNSPGATIGDRIPEPGTLRPPPSDVGDWNYFLKSGTNSQKWLDAVFKSKQADFTPISWERGYKRVDHAPISWVPDAEVQAITKLESGPGYMLMNYKSEGAPTIAFNNIFHKDKGAIVALVNFKSQDVSAPAVRLKWSDLMWQSWKETAGDKANSLRWVVQDNIVNSHTESIMIQAHGKVGFPPNQNIGKFWYHGADDSMKESFLALAGTDNVRGVFRIAANYRNELDNAWVKNIYTIKSGPHIIVELGRGPRPAKRSDIQGKHIRHSSWKKQPITI
ncbi:hypothetical protein CPC735_014250 [Coccidioides posadasii C735 delta SOWgp]|uniref:Uncharacterized protein n=2 Tax=Coccidioides posadasii TaxID=199306 RepID=A0A0J6II88_COCPO|nr:hypothetical protein CPC735_014250 [Coccidioides posadasii C735 delta SOWgp]EER24830.1 hypothetical protein CPC735_014250 [Coccidioides posadasii C735 delta SOWgp]KMM71577.1 hypothetical protein CPAG_07883 [Coccidioides posadasii RMSCC 3488]|eukprot:XP_003066975.1 hypothetical protein CPC735_014250 [Coccidioides posadasii C735 delta SOWgp]